MEKSKEIVLRTKLTGKLFGVIALPIACALALLYFALDAGRKFGPQDPTRYVFVGIPAAISAFLLLAIMGVCFHYLGRTITVTKDQIIYKDSKIVMTLDIAEMAYSPPVEGAMMRMLMFSDGRTFVQMPALFLGDRNFNRLAGYIKKTRSESNQVEQKTYSL